MWIKPSVFGYLVYTFPTEALLNKIFMAKGLTKSQFMTALGEAWGMSKKEATEAYETFVGLVQGEVREKGELMLPGLGKLVKQDRKARMGRNPATGEQIHIPAKTVVKFRVNKAAKEAIL